MGFKDIGLTYYKFDVNNSVLEGMISNQLLSNNSQRTNVNMLQGKQFL